MINIMKKAPAANWKLQRQTAPPTFGHARLLTKNAMETEITKRAQRCREILGNAGGYCDFVKGKVNLVVLSCKRWHALKRLIDSMRPYFAGIEKYPKIEKILVDNGSGGKLIENVKKENFFDRVISHSENLGMVGALRDAYRKIDGEYVLLLEDDFILEYDKGFIARAIDIFNEFPEIGIIRLKNQNNWWKPYRVVGPLRKTRKGTEFWTWLPSRNGTLNVWTSGSVMFRKAGYFAAGELPEVKRNIPRKGIFERRTHQGYIYECVYAKKFNKLWLAAKIKDCYPFFQPNLNKESTGWTE